MDSLLAGHQTGEIMRTNFTKIAATDEIMPLMDLLKKGAEKNFLIVEPESDQIIGVLTEGALLKAIKAKDVTATVAKYQINDFNKITVTDTLQMVFRKMQESESNIFPVYDEENFCLLYTSPSPRDQRGSRMPSSA